MFGWGIVGTYDFELQPSEKMGAARLSVGTASRLNPKLYSLNPKLHTSDPKLLNPTPEHLRYFAEAHLRRLGLSAPIEAPQGSSMDSTSRLTRGSLREGFTGGLPGGGQRGAHPSKGCLGVRILILALTQRFYCQRSLSGLKFKELWMLPLGRRLGEKLLWPPKPC